jgi:hypothetical protein
MIPQLLLPGMRVPTLCIIISCCLLYLNTAGKYLEIFGRKNNLRNYWVTIGNEVTGQGPPKGDQRAIEDGLRIPNAVYGRTG